MPLSKIFLDSSVILSGLASSSGGSGKLFNAAKGGKLKLMTTPLVIEEVNNHLAKLDIELKQLENLLSTKIISLVKNPTDAEIEKFSRVSRDSDDTHVLAGASLSGAEKLISLDKKHILTLKVRKYLKPMLVQSPKEFWNRLREREN